MAKNRTMSPTPTPEEVEANIRATMKLYSKGVTVVDHRGRLQRKPAQLNEHMLRVFLKSCQNT